MAAKKTKKTKATEAAYPFRARTNKSTTLIRLGSTSETLPSGHSLTVFAEDGQFGTVNTQVGGELMGGSVFTADYDRVV